jgi:iron complex outermembrane recepter protein
MKRFLTLFVLSAMLGTMAAFAQPPQGPTPEQLPRICKISGSIVNRDTKLPVEYATVAVQSMRDGKIISGTIANKQGTFTVDKLPPGRFRLKITFLSYKAAYVDSILVTPREPEKNVGQVQLEPSITKTDEVKVTADRELVQYAVDRKVYSMEKDITSVGGTAVDVLQNIPSVTVDVDRTISLRGSTNLTILIDGKPSTMSGSTVLDQIPSENIDRIEVITNPSARFDADGTAGIINIVLKKNQLAGYNGTVTLNAGTGDKYNGSANINYRLDNVNLFANYSYNSNIYWFRGTAVQENTLRENFTIDQISTGRFTSRSHFARAGLDWTIDDVQTLSVSGSYNPRVSPRTNTTSYDFVDSLNREYDRQVRDNLWINQGYNVEANTSYKYIFGPQHFLSADVRYSEGVSTENLFAQQTYLVPHPFYGLLWLQNTRNPTTTRLWVIQSDYEQTFAGGYKLEAGVKTNIRAIDNDFLSESKLGAEDFKTDVNLTNRFMYDEQVYAAYATFAGGIGSFGYSAGLRAEQTFYTANQITTRQRLDSSYLSLFPSVALKYKLPDEHEFGLAYSRRINRPVTEQLNPFTQFNDPYNLQFGNPTLRPEFINSFELSYLKFWEHLTLNLTAFYRQTDGVISRFRTVSPEGITSTTFRNFNTMQAGGAELTAQYEAFKWWRINLMGSYFLNRINADNLQGGLQNQGFGGNLRFISNMRLPEGIDFQVTYFYFLPTVLAQGVMQPIHGADIALKKDFLEDNRLSVALRVSDLFDTRQFGILTQGVGFEQDFVRKRESRILNLSVSYRFSGGAPNDQQQPQRRKRGSGDEQTPQMDEGF